MGQLSFVHLQLALPSKVSFFLPSCSALCDAIGTIADACQREAFQRDYLLRPPGCC